MSVSSKLCIECECCSSRLNWERRRKQKKETGKLREGERKRQREREQNFKKDQKNENGERTRKGAKRGSEKVKMSMDVTQGKVGMRKGER